MDLFKKCYQNSDSLKSEDLENWNKISKEHDKVLKDLISHAENVTVKIAIEHKDITAPYYICNPKDVKRYKPLVACIGHSNKNTRLFTSTAIPRDSIYIIRCQYLYSNAGFVFKEVKLWE